MRRADTASRHFDTTLLDALTHPDAFDHDADNLDRLETHISWLLLAGDFVYKIKKPITLDFLDFGSLDKRHFFCVEEVRLNKRWAPSLYLDVVPITINNGRPRIGGHGRPIEYAVKMRRFGDAQRLDRQLEQGLLEQVDMRNLANHIAEQHADAVRALDGERVRTIALTKTLMWDNFPPLEETIGIPDLNPLRDWTRCELERVDDLLQRRFDGGFFRECHGDLHLGNLVRLEEGIRAFDCIEFSADLRRIDVICDVAFLVMDLVARERHDLAAGFLNRYLERSGDYGAVQMLDLYFVYRCLVRAKVAAIRWTEAETVAAKESDLSEVWRYVAMAGRQIGKNAPILVVMNGLPGSGKSWVSERLMTALPAIRLRSDTERKRVFSLSEREASHSGLGQGIYTPEANRAVYQCLADDARTILNAGHNVVLDAAFLQSDDRQQAFDAARECGSAAVLVCVDAPNEILRERILQRARRGTDASEAGLAVLERQRRLADPVSEVEKAHTVFVDNGSALDVSSLVDEVKSAGRAELRN